MDHKIVGRKVFILNPHSVMTEELIERLLAAEYEVYLLKDRNRTLRVLHRFPDSVLFINIDSGAKEDVWKIYVRNLMRDPALENVQVGILSYNASAELAKAYLMEIGVQCGFVRLRLGVNQSTRIMLRALRANEAKGRRKYVRVQAGNDPHTGFNVPYHGDLLSGKILDISSVGMAAQFGSTVKIPQKTRLPDLQLRLRSSLVRVTGVVLSQREDRKSVYVILFEHSVETKARHQIRMYIHRRLQEEIDIVAGQVDSGRPRPVVLSG